MASDRIKPFTELIFRSIAYVLMYRLSQQLCLFSVYRHVISNGGKILKSEPVRKTSSINGLYPIFHFLWGELPIGNYASAHINDYALFPIFRRKIGPLTAMAVSEPCGIKKLMFCFAKLAHQNPSVFAVTIFYINAQKISPVNGLGRSAPANIVC